MEGVKNVLWLIVEEAECHTDEDVGKQEAHRSYYETSCVYTWKQLAAYQRALSVTKHPNLYR